MDLRSACALALAALAAIALAASRSRSPARASIVTAQSGPECRDWQERHPEWIFCDDFESDEPLVGVGRYFEYGAADGDFVPIDGVGVDGSRGMRALFREGTVGAGGLKLAFGRNPNAYMRSSLRADEDFREIFYRVYVRMAEGWVGNPAKLSRATVFAERNDWSQAMIAHLWGGRGHVLAVDPVRCVGEDNQVKCRGYNDFEHMDWLGYAFGHTPLFATRYSGRWFCVEAHVRLNRPGVSDGIQQFWIDGLLEARRDGLDFVRSYTEYAINAVFLENYWNDGSPREQERYLDNFVVSSERIGCLDSNPKPTTEATASASPSTTVTASPRTTATASHSATGTPSASASATRPARYLVWLPILDA